jgi:hypothetical protein
VLLVRFPNPQILKGTHKHVLEGGVRCGRGQEQKNEGYIKLVKYGNHTSSLGIGVIREEITLRARD